jgi:hypothetical protein
MLSGKIRMRIHFRHEVKEPTGSCRDEAGRYSSDVHRIANHDDLNDLVFEAYQRGIEPLMTRKLDAISRVKAAGIYHVRARIDCTWVLMPLIRR